MSENKELSVLNELFEGENALATQSAEELRELASLSQASSFLQRLQLYSKGKSGPSGTIIEGGHFGVPQGDNIEDLGNSIDVLVLARKAKAIDMSDSDNIIVTNDTTSDEFKRIEDMANNVKDSGCAYGPTYLVYERSTRKFYEFFCGNKSGRVESSKINEYLPVTNAMITAGVTNEKEPRFAKPMTLKSSYVKKGKWEWFAPKAEDCLQKIDLPTADALRSEMERFLKKESPEVQTASEDSRQSKRKR